MGRFKKITPVRTPKRVAEGSPALSSPALSTGGSSVCSTASAVNVAMRLVSGRVSLSLSPFAADPIAADCATVLVSLGSSMTDMEDMERTRELEGEVASLRAKNRQLKSSLRAACCERRLFESQLREQHTVYRRLLKDQEASSSASLRRLSQAAHEEKRELKQLRYERRRREAAVREVRELTSELEIVCERAAALQAHVHELEAQVGRAVHTGLTHRANLELASNSASHEKKCARASAKKVSAEIAARAEAEMVCARAVAERERVETELASSEQLLAEYREEQSKRLEVLHDDFEQQVALLNLAASEALLKEQQWKSRVREMEAKHRQPSEKHWDTYSEGGTRWARKTETDAILDFLFSHEWRAEDIAHALAEADFAEGVFAAREFWRLRIPWLRDVCRHMQDEHWSASKTVALMVALNLSERSTMEARNVLGKQCAAIAIAACHLHVALAFLMLPPHRSPPPRAGTIQKVTFLRFQYSRATRGRRPESLCCCPLRSLQSRNGLPCTNRCVRK